MPITPINLDKNIAVINTHNKSGYATWGDNEVTWGDAVLTWGAPIGLIPKNGTKHTITPLNADKS